MQIGQATTIHHWVYEDGTEGGPASAGAELPESTERPSDEELSRAGPLPGLPACVPAATSLHGLCQQDWMCNFITGRSVLWGSMPLICSSLMVKGRFYGPRVAIHILMTAHPKSPVGSRGVMGAAEEAVAEQAALVRALKEEHGLANDDEEVTENVALLLRRKAKLERLQQRVRAADLAAAEAGEAQEAPA